MYEVSWFEWDVESNIIVGTTLFKNKAATHIMTAPKYKQRAP
jgi:hypothetical protein